MKEQQLADLIRRVEAKDQQLADLLRRVEVIEQQVQKGPSSP